MHTDKLFHLNFDPNEFHAEFALMPGDPGRVPLIAKTFKNYKQISNNREYNVYLAETENGKNVFICSTGIGGPSTAIAAEELHMAGVHTFIRVGTCGGIDTSIVGGDIIIATSAIRQEGTALHYAPIEYPATATHSVVCALEKGAIECGFNPHIGVVQCKDSFYGQHDPGRMPVSYELKEKWNAWKSLGVLCSEMESATLFTVAASLGCSAGTVLSVLWNQEREALGIDNPMVNRIEDAINCAHSAVEILSRK